MILKSFKSAKSWILDRWFIKNPRLRLWVTRLLYGSKDVEISLMGVPLVVNSAKENGYLRASKIAQTSSLWRDEASTLCALFATLRPGDLFVDVGANIGVFSCVVARLPGVEVLAIEANPETFQRLEANCHHHRIHAINTAVSNADQLLDFSIGAVSHVFAASTHRNAYHFGESVQIHARPLDDLVHGTRPVVLKIDVEGHEPEVLEGASKLLSEKRVHAVLLDASKEARKAAKWLENHGFAVVDPVNFKPLTEDSGVYLALAPERLRVLGLN
jgi:FkbM family methyltransferase